MDCIVYKVAKSRTRLSDFHFHHLLKWCVRVCVCARAHFSGPQVKRQRRHLRHSKRETGQDPEKAVLRKDFRRLWAQQGVASMAGQLCCRSSFSWWARAPGVGGR